MGLLVATRVKNQNEDARNGCGPTVLNHQVGWFREWWLSRYVIETEHLRHELLPWTVLSNPINPAYLSMTSSRRA